METIRKIFYSWIKLQLKIHLSNVKKFPKEKQIWWASLGQNVGVEINGKNDKFERPVLVIKRYSQEAMLILPISSKRKKSEYDFYFIDNTGRKNIIKLSQPRMISNKRFIRRMSGVDNKTFELMKNKFKDFI